MSSTTISLNYDRRVKAIADLREYIALQEDTLDELTGVWSSTGLYYHPGPYDQVKDDLARWIRAMKRRGAEIAKDYGDENYGTLTVRAEFPAFTVSALASRSAVCERVAVGQREVTETIPDPELVADVPMVEVTRTVTDYRWECSPIMDAEAR